MTIKFRTVLLALSVSILAAGCASSPPAATQVASSHSSGGGAVCSEEAPTGSHLRKSICRTPEQIKHDQEVAQKLAGPGSHGMAGHSGAQATQ